MMAKTFPITGIKVPAGDPLPERPDIDLWFSKRTSRHESLQLSLVVRALSILMNKDPDDELSYFSIAGIHGQPWHSWDGISKTKNFCAHAEPTFPTWHRPYQLLLEQRLHEIMKEIITSKGQDISQREWQRAADTWRFPYWDWTTSRLPDIVIHGNSLRIQKLDRSEDTERVRNPFWQFSIPGGKSFQELGATATDFEKTFEPTRATSKWGVLTAEVDPEEPWNDGIQNWAAANDALDLRSDKDWQSWKAGGTIAEAVCRMFSPHYHSTWDSFATTKRITGEKEDAPKPEEENDAAGPGYLSLEFIHNKIHVWTGGSSITTGAGHMSTLGFAAFDPLFWLHHCNVDRLTSIWLLLYPNKFFDQSPEVGKEALTPFHRDSNGTPWTSFDVKDTEPLGYSYDVLHHRSGQKRDRYLSGLRKAINERYGQVRKELSKFPKLKGKKNDYVVDVIYDRYGYNDGEPYTIHFFLGPVDGEPSLYGKHPNHIDILYTFSNQLATVPGPSEGESTPKCKNCAQQKADGVLSKGQIILTNALLRDATDANNSELNSLEPGEVNRYLKEHLNWRAVDNHGNEINIEQELPQTKIFALKGIADHYEDSSRLSCYHDYEILPEPCQGKPGGVETL